VTDGVFGHNVAVKWEENDNGFTAIIFLGLPLQSTTKSTIITKFVSRGIHDTNCMMMEKFFDTVNDVLEKHPITIHDSTEDVAVARSKLQEVLDRFPNGGLRVNRRAK